MSVLHERPRMIVNGLKLSILNLTGAEDTFNRLLHNSEFERPQQSRLLKNTVREGENAANCHCLHFPQCTLTPL